MPTTNSRPGQALAGPRGTTGRRLKGRPAVNEQDAAERVKLGRSIMSHSQFYARQAEAARLAGRDGLARVFSQKARSLKEHAEYIALFGTG